MPDDPAARAIDCMNRGYALLGRGTPTDLRAAIAAYDEAIALLTPLAVAGRSPPEIAPAVPRNSLGASWMNRGLALHGLSTPAAVAESVASQREAIRILERVPADATPWRTINLSASWMNLANALLDSDLPGRALAAREAAAQAIRLSAPGEMDSLPLGEIGVLSRRALCDAIGQLLPAPPAGLTAEALAAEASDAVDEGLALWSSWERRGGERCRPAALRLFTFGAELYRLHQPQFLAEFLAENLGASRENPGRRNLLLAAQSACARALEDLCTPGRPVVDGEVTRARLQTLRELRSMAAWIASELRAPRAGSTLP